MDAEPSSATTSNEVTIGDTNITKFRIPGLSFTIDSTDISAANNILPSANNSKNLGSSSLRWANLYVNDMHFSNEGKAGGNDIDGTTGNWTLQEGADHLYIINNKTGKRYKMGLQEVD